MLVQTGNADVVIAGGVESMSNVEYYSTDARWGGRLGSMTLHDRLTRARATVSPEERFGPISGMIETAENLTKKYEIPREAQDDYALSSHQRAVAPIGAGKFAREIVPVPVPQTKGNTLIIDWDEGPRADSSIESLARLAPIMEGGTITAGNASAQNDAAAVCLVVAADKLEELGLEPMAYLVGWATAGVHPAYMGIGPVPAVQRVFEKTGLSFEDIGLIELNEAFAVQMLSVLREWQLPDEDILNVNGWGISLGHPIGATGARILATLLHEMVRPGCPLRPGDDGGGAGHSCNFREALG